jgi:hypothetical protein
MTALLGDLSHQETLTMQSLTLAGVTLLAATLLTACGTESGPTGENAAAPAAAVTGHNTADHSSYTIAFTETDLNPCNGEQVALAGTIVGQDNVVGIPEGLLHHEINEVVSETGVGLTTGAPYTLSATFHESFNSPNGPALNVTFSTRESVRVTSTTPGLNYTVLTTIYFVGLPSGEFKFTKFVDHEYVCQG